jgi:hypothetical protein
MLPITEPLRPIIEFVDPTGYVQLICLKERFQSMRSMERLSFTKSNTQSEGLGLIVLGLSAQSKA